MSVLRGEQARQLYIRSQQHRPVRPQHDDRTTATPRTTDRHSSEGRAAQTTPPALRRSPRVPTLGRSEALRPHPGRPVCAPEALPQG